MHQSAGAAESPPAGDSAESCSVLRAAGVLGDFWSIGVLRCAVYGMRRYGEFQRELGVATNVLAARLAQLVEAGVLERVRYQERPPRDEYTLTPAGRELVPLVLALKAWGDRHLQPDGPYTAARHRGCASALQVVARCPDCDATVHPEDVDTVPLRSPALAATSATTHSPG